MTLTNGGLINIGSKAAAQQDPLALSDGLACFTGSFSGVTSTSISHGLNSSDLVVEFKDSAGNLLIPDNWSITNLNVIEAEFSPAATGDVTIIACIESGLAPITGGVTLLEGLSGIIDLDSPNGSIDISTSGQVINLNAIFTAASGALLEQKCRDIDILSGLLGAPGGVTSVEGVSGAIDLDSSDDSILISTSGQTIFLNGLFTAASGAVLEQKCEDIITLSGLIGTGGGGSGVSIELFFTPTSGNNFVLEHGLNTDIFTWDMWSTDFDPIRTIQPTNVYPSGSDHVAVELDWPASGRLVLTTGGTGPEGPQGPQGPSGLQGLSGGVTTELFFTPTSGNVFVLEHGLDNNAFTWDMWSTDLDPIRTIQPTNVYPSGSNHVAIELDAPASGRIVLTTGGSNLFTPASGALLEQKCEDIDTVSGLVVNATTHVQEVLSTHIESNQVLAAESVHGALHSILTGVTLDTSTTQTPNNGLGKMVLVVNAGADVDGTIYVSGIIINRDTGAASTGISQIPVTGVSTDNLTTDAEGNPIYDITNAYITDEWFKGPVTIHTPDTNISDLDVYQCSFEQWNDVSGVVINTFDINLLTTTSSAWAYAYLYTVETSGLNNTLCSINNISSCSVSSADSVADRYWRLRRGGIDRPIVGIHDGMFANVFFGTAGGHIRDFTMKIWATLDHDLDTG
ncbi:MAG: hypothetical protein ACXABY_01725 [Candidatus Thorarchaeota archaeon]|jgi:hypothetical protein